MIRTFFTAQEAEGQDFSGTVTVVIDVLRATSVMTNALNNGARRILAVTEPADALKLRDLIGKEDVVLGGERKMDRIEGFDLGNSPQDYTEGRVRGKTVVMTTTNGTLALHNARTARVLYAASVINWRAVCRAVMRSFGKTGGDVAIVCAGTNGVFSLEDAYCAGLIVSFLRKEEMFSSVFLDDKSLACTMLAEAFSKEKIEGSAHYRNLVAKGYEEDAVFCLFPIEMVDVVGVARFNEELSAMEDVGNS